MKFVDFILKCLIFVVKEIISFFIKFFLFLVVIFAIIGVFSSKQIKKEFAVNKGSFIEMDLSKKVMERKSNIPQIFNESEISFYSLLMSMDKIAKDPNIDGILIKLDNASLNYAQIEEFNAKLDELKKNSKKIYAYSSSISNSNYSIAVKADRIIMPPASGTNVNMTGYYTELGYYKKFLDKIGIDFNVIHVGDYKSYGENYTKSEISPEYRDNLISLLDKRYNRFLTDISSSGRITKDVFERHLLDGDLMVSDSVKLKELKLIDELKYYDTLKEEIGKKKIIGFSKYIISQGILQNPFTSGDKIALICAEGEIIDHKIKGSSNSYIYPEGIASDIDKALEDDSVKGIVIRINSPGGSALASDIISDKVRRAGKIKPIYISVAGMAASGGYYISSAGKKIYADNNSITGSIGVVSLIPNIKRLVSDKGEINIETLKKGEYSDVYSLTKDFTQEKYQKLYSSCERVYDDFISNVALGRKMSKADIDKIAQGRVWMGSDGKIIGLVDEIGGLDKCIKDMGKDLGLTEYSVLEVTTVPTIDSIFEEYMPFAKAISEIRYFMYDKDSFLKPAMYFPYDLQQ